MYGRSRYTKMQEPGSQHVEAVEGERHYGSGPGSSSQDTRHPEQYLPVAYISAVHDAGAWEEGDHGTKEPTAWCPHCGSAGRYIYHLVDMGGNEWAAMAGCVEAWPGGKEHARQYQAGQEDLEELARSTKGGKALVDAGAFDAYGWPAQHIANPFLREMLTSLQRFGKLSEKQVALALRMIDEGRHTVDERAERQAQREQEDEARRAKGGQVVEAKGATIQGTILRITTRDSGYGVQVKWMVEAADGCRYWGTMPTAAMDLDLDEGHRVQFVANVQGSNDDPMFGFIARPRKVEALA